MLPVLCWHSLGRKLFTLTEKTEEKSLNTVTVTSELVSEHLCYIREDVGL